jgi:hypothetical protein
MTMGPKDLATRLAQIAQRQECLNAAGRGGEFPPYSVDERRVCDYLVSLSDAIGCGEDPIGFLIASHGYINAVFKSRMELRPIAEMPPELKNGRGLMLYGRHATDSGREGGFRKGDHWWAIAVWNVWREASRQRWVYALNGEPLIWGEPTHYCELKAP